jgi:D-alanyl-D-alanine carboxypeptidase
MALALVGAGCSSDSTAGDPSPAESTQLTIDGPALTTLVEQMAEEMQAPGVAVQVRSPQGEFDELYGTTELDGGRPITFDDHVRVGSNTKTFTGTAILQLVQEGKLSLDDPVAQYIDGVPDGENIPIRLLLNMRSGLFNYSETLALNESLDKTPEAEWTPQDLLDLAFSNPPYFAPGEGYHYSNTNSVLLGLIIEQLDGKPLPQVFQDRFYGPLGLTGSSFPPSDTSAIPDPFARGYMFGTNVETMDDPALPPAEQEEAAAGTLLPNDVTDENPSWTWAAGQMISTADDLTTWVRALGDGSLLDEQMQQERLDSIETVNPDDPNSPGYGYNLAQLGPMYGHTGELPGYNSFMGYDPQTQLSIVVWSNLGSAADGRPVATSIARELIGAIYPQSP